MIVSLIKGDIITCAFAMDSWLTLLMKEGIEGRVEKISDLGFHISD
jgi:hypothetical protein